MIVVDVNILIDALFEKNEKRRKIALEFLELLKDKVVYAPKIFLIELIAVTRRLGIKIDKEELFDWVSDFNFIPEEEIFNIAIYVVDKVHPRAIDAYYIATAILTGSFIVSNDRILVENAKKAGIEAYYLLEEFEKVKRRLEEI